MQVCEIYRLVPRRDNLIPYRNPGDLRDLHNNCMSKYRYEKDVSFPCGILQRHLRGTFDTRRKRLRSQ
jgi:hypothetical protein